MFEGVSSFSLPWLAHASSKLFLRALFILRKFVLSFNVSKKIPLFSLCGCSFWNFLWKERRAHQHSFWRHSRCPHLGWLASDSWFGTKLEGWSQLNKRNVLCSSRILSQLKKNVFSVFLSRVTAWSWKLWRVTAYCLGLFTRCLTYEWVVQ